MSNWKMALALLKCVLEKNFPLPIPSQRTGLRFSLCQQKWKIGVGHYDKMALVIQKCFLDQNLQLLTPQSLSLQSSDCQWKW